AQSQELVGRSRSIDPAKERLEHFARPAWISSDPRGHGKLIIGRASERVVAKLAREALGDGQCFDRFPAALQQVERRSGVEPDLGGLSYRQIPRIEQLLGTAQRLRSRDERKQPADRADLELPLASGALQIGIVEEV